MLELEPASYSSSSLEELNSLDRKSSNSHVFEWTTSKTQELISRYQSLRELWDVSCPAYRNRWKKRKAWKILAEYLNTGELEVRRKMHNLRSQFSQEVRKKKSSWHFYSSIEFLKDVSNSNSPPKIYHSFSPGRGLDVSAHPVYDDSLFKNNITEGKTGDDSDSSESNISSDPDQIWTKQKTKELIACYQNYPELWNRVDSNYRDKQKRKEAVECLAKPFNVTPQEIQRKIHNLRSQYCQEQKKSLKNIYESSWYYLPYLKFLDQSPFSQESFMCEENSSIIKYPYTENCPEDVYKLLRQLNSEQLLNDDGCLSLPKVEARRQENQEEVENNPRMSEGPRDPEEGPTVCFNWTIQATTELIHTFQSYVELWDTTSADYRNRSKKQRIFASLARQFGVDEEELHRKLHNLRSQFNQEFKKVQTKPNFQSSWCFYAPMLFLKQKNGISSSTPILVKREPHGSTGSSDNGQQIEFDNQMDEGSADRSFLSNCLEPIINVHTVTDQNVSTNTPGWFQSPPPPCSNDSTIAAIKAEPMTFPSSAPNTASEPLLNTDFYRHNPSSGFEDGSQQSKGFWTVTKTRQLIANYESLPELWDASCITYRNRSKRRKAWQFLASEFHVTKEEVQRKMHNIRSQFSQELRRETRPNHESSWVFYSSMHFLHKTTHRRDF